MQITVNDLIEYLKSYDPQAKLKFVDVNSRVYDFGHLYKSSNRFDEDTVYLKLYK